VLCGPDAALAVLPWDGPEVAALLAGQAGGGPVVRAIDEADVVVAFTRSEPVLAALDARARCLIAHDPTPPPGGPHAARWLEKAIGTLVESAPADSRDPGVLVFTEAERRDAGERTRELPTGFLAVHPGSGSPSKNWPWPRFLEAARRLAAGRPWLLMAGPAEHALVLPPDALLARDWPLRRLAAAIARAELFLGNDAGVSHLAAAVGAPTLALFGPTDPAIWAPVGPRVATRRPKSASLADLQVEEVVAAAQALRSAASGLPSG